MKRAIHSIGICVVLAAATCGVAGCQEQATIGPHQTAAQSDTKPPAEQSFEVILEKFRRGIEGVRVGFVMRGEGGHSMMSGDNKVSHELIRPAKEGDPYKAIITVDSQSTYSIKRSTTRDEESHPEEGSGLDDPNASLGGIGGSVGEGIESFDPELVSAPDPSGTHRRPSSPASETTVARRPNEIRRAYELLYDNGKWKLVTKLDDETEQSIENAFEQALKTQI